MRKLIEIIDQYIVTPHVVEERARLSHYPSEASAISRLDGKSLGKCHRAAWHKWMKHKETNPVDARGMWTFKHGNLIESAYTAYFKELGVWAGNNVKWYNTERNLSGEIDIFIFDEEHEIIGVEIKTAYGYGFQKSTSQAPKPENVMQVMLYLDHWRDLTDEWRLIYHARDTQEKAEYVITLGKDEIGTHAIIDGIPLKMFYLEDIYSRYEELGKHVLLGTPPKKDYKYGYEWVESEERFERGDITKTTLSKVKSGSKVDADWRCLYCPFLEKCWAEKRQAMKKK